MRAISGYVFILVLLGLCAANQVRAEAPSVGGGAPSYRIKQIFAQCYSRALSWGSDTSVYLGNPSNTVHWWVSGYVQDFSGGRYGDGIIMLKKGDTKAFSVWGDNWKLFKQNPMPGTNPPTGGVDWLGYPTSDARPPTADEVKRLRWFDGTPAPAGKAGSVQYFDNGYITFTDGKGAYWTRTTASPTQGTLTGDPRKEVEWAKVNDKVIFQLYSKYGEEILGLPFDNGGGMRIHEWGPNNGYWVWDLKGGKYGESMIIKKKHASTAHATYGIIRIQYLKNNSLWSYGEPTTEIYWDTAKGCWRQDYTNGQSLFDNSSLGGEPKGENVDLYLKAIDLASTSTQKGVDIYTLINNERVSESTKFGLQAFFLSVDAGIGLTKFGLAMKRSQDLERAGSKMLTKLRDDEIDTCLVDLAIGSSLRVPKAQEGDFEKAQQLADYYSAHVKEFRQLPPFVQVKVLKWSGEFMRKTTARVVAQELTSAGFDLAMLGLKM